MKNKAPSESKFEELKKKYDLFSKSIAKFEKNKEVFKIEGIN
jgi:hypothetical protein